MKHYKGTALIKFDIIASTEDEVHDSFDGFDMGDCEVELINIEEEEPIDPYWDLADMKNDERKVNDL